MGEFLRVLERNHKKMGSYCQGRRQKIFQGGRRATRIEPVLTTKNKIFFEIWEVSERVCENLGRGHSPQLSLADAHAYCKICEKTVFAHEFWGDNQYFGSLSPRTAL